MRIIPAMLNTEINEHFVDCPINKIKTNSGKKSKSIWWRKEKPLVENMGQWVQVTPGKILIGHKRRIFLL